MPAAVGPWRVLELVGQGGMGIVYRARRQDGEPGPDVALKVLRAAAIGGQVERRFQREVEVLRRLDHPGIARLLDAGTTADGTPWLATEFIEGSTLARWRIESDASIAERVRLLAELCEAVQAAHEHGVVHRDLKPDNVLVTAGGRPKVLDFGIARLQADDVPLATLATQTWQLLGTVRYMSPEQAAGGGSAIDARTDIYTLGVIAYELLTGTLPYDLARLSTPRALLEITTAEPRPLGGRDRQLELVVQHALEKDPDRRYQTAAAMAGDLRCHLEGRRVSLRAPGLWRRAQRALRARPRLQRWLAIAAATIAVTAAVAAAMLAGRTAPAPSWRAVMAGIEEADQLRHAGPATRANYEAAIALFQQSRIDLARMPATPYRPDLERYVRWRLGELHFFLGDLEHDYDTLELARGYWRDAVMPAWVRGSALEVDGTSSVRSKVLRLGRHHPHTGVGYAMGAKALLREPAFNLQEAHRAHVAALDGLADGDQNYQTDMIPEDRADRLGDLAWARLNSAVALAAWGATVDSVHAIDKGIALIATADPDGVLTSGAALSILAEARGMAWLRRAGIPDAAADAALDSAYFHLGRSLEMRGLAAGRQSWKLAMGLAIAGERRVDRGHADAATRAALVAAELTMKEVMANLRPGVDALERAQAQAALAGLAARRAALADDAHGFARADSLLAAADSVLVPARFPVPAAEAALRRAQVARWRFAMTRDGADSVAAVGAIRAAGRILPATEYPALHRRLADELALVASGVR